MKAKLFFGCLKQSLELFLLPTQFFYQPLLEKTVEFVKKLLLVILNLDTL